MNGAESIVSTLRDAGVEVCFANPGTSEMHIVAALDRSPAIRCVLGLFEGVVTGAADGYARMAEKPACTLLHLGPGFANGIANLHNAYRAHVPLVNIIGEHASGHLRYDTPLTSDIAALAKPHSKWLRTCNSASEAGQDAAEASIAASTAPGQIATLIVPADVAWSDGGETGKVRPAPKPPLPARERIDAAVSMLRSGARTAILLSGDALYGRGLATAGRVAAGTNAKLFASYPFTRLQRGAGSPIVDRIPYPLDQAIELLKEFQQIILVGAQAPVAYFARPNKSAVASRADCKIEILAQPGEDYRGALDALEAALSLGGIRYQAEKAEQPPVPTGNVTLPGLAATVAAVLPENAIVCDESMTSGRGMLAAARGCPSHDWLACTGGSIGIAMPLAIGAAVACPTRPVLCLTADGSGMYTLQALWTMAREGLKITTVVLANRAYEVLKREFASLGIGNPVTRASQLFEIGDPDIDWVSLAKGMGVPGTRVNSLDEFAKALRNGFESAGPTLIEVLL
jgi:acetolactate synthase I/II/III large subunit